MGGILIYSFGGVKENFCVPEIIPGGDEQRGSEMEEEKFLSLAL
jgi:hypothetical protein